jgi:zona occludens toxin
MIIGREGQPRSGKSYETVKVDLIEAIKAKRRVYVRLNGLKLDRIAEFVEMPVSEVEGLVTFLGETAVVEMLLCETREDGGVDFPHLERGALVIVDECHEYYPVGRAALPKEAETFFAKHGHWGLDVVLLSQDFKEVHRSVVRRMQKKNYYTKLDALGKDNSYSVRFYAAPTAGKFELIGSEQRKYDPVYWLFYDGIQPGVESNNPYKVGSKTLWQMHRKSIILMSIAVLVGIGLLARFFLGGALTDSMAGKSKPEPTPVVASRVTQEWPTTKTPPQAVPRAIPEVVKVPERKFPAGIAHVLDTAKRARPRYLGSFRAQDFVEFRAEGAEQVSDRLTGDQLRALGWTVTREVYGLKAEYDDQTLIFTQWPNDPPMQQSQAQTDRIRAAGPPVVSASEEQPGTAGALVAKGATKLPFGAVASYGAMGVGASPR